MSTTRERVFFSVNHLLARRAGTVSVPTADATSCEAARPSVPPCAEHDSSDWRCPNHRTQPTSAVRPHAASCRTGCRSTVRFLVRWPRHCPFLSSSEVIPARRRESTGKSAHPTHSRPSHRGSHKSGSVVLISRMPLKPYTVSSAWCDGNRRKDSAKSARPRSVPHGSSK